MKTTYIKQISVCLLLAGLQACTSADHELPEAGPTPNEPMIISARQANTPSTRLGYEDKGSSGVTLTWSRDDAFAVYGTEGKAEFTLVGDGGTTTGDFIGTAAGEGPYKAFYPYSKATAPTQDGCEMDVTMQAQTTNADMSHLDAHTFMTGDVTFDGNDKASVAFEHRMVMMKMVITLSGSLPSGENLSYLELSTDKTDAFILKQDVYGNNTLKHNLQPLLLTGVTPDNNKLTLYMMMHSFTLNDGDKLSFKLCTTDNTNFYYYTVTKELTSDISFEAGKRYIAEATLSISDVGLNEPDLNIKQWEKEGDGSTLPGDPV